MLQPTAVKPPMVSQLPSGAPLVTLEFNLLPALTAVNGGLPERCRTVSELADRLGMGLATASHHLKEVRRAGAITMERHGRHVYCGINARALRELAATVNALTPFVSLEEMSYG